MYIVQTGCKPEYVFWVKQKPPTRNIEVTLPFCFTLAFIAIPWPKASSYKLGTEEQTGGFNFSITGIKKKIQLVKTIHIMSTKIWARHNSKVLEGLSECFKQKKITPVSVEQQVTKISWTSSFYKWGLYQFWLECFRTNCSCCGGGHFCGRYYGETMYSGDQNPDFLKIRFQLIRFSEGKAAQL